MGAFAYRVDASADQCSPDDRGDGDGVREPTKGSPMSKENTAAGTARTAGTQVNYDSFTDVGRYRQLCPSPTLTPNRDPTVHPIDIIQIQADDLAGAQTQSGEQQ